LIDGAPSTAAKSNGAARTRIDPTTVMDAIRAALSKGKQTKAELVQATGFDASRVTNALTKLDKEVKSVAANEKEKISKRNTASQLVKAK